MVYYSTFPLQQQAKKQHWYFQLKAVFMIAIMDFNFDRDPRYANIYRHDSQLKNQQNDVFYDKLTYICLEMPTFTKTLEELANHYEKWLYLIKHVAELECIPERFQEKIF